MASVESTDSEARRVDVPQPPDFNNTPETLRAIYSIQVHQAVAVNNINGKLRRMDSKISEHKALEEKVTANREAIAEQKPTIAVMRWVGRISGVAFLVWAVNRMLG